MRAVLAVLGLCTALAFASSAGTPTAQIQLRVIDDSGSVVTGAPVIVSTFSRWVPGDGFGHDESHKVAGVTDAGGVVTFTLPSKTGELRCWVRGESDGENKMIFNNDAYYVDRGQSVKFIDSKGGRWQPWGQCVDIHIKKVKNPIPMLARRFSISWPELQLPAKGVPVGYDLARSDWVAPYGKGEYSDLIFRLEVSEAGLNKIDRVPLYEATFTVSFSREGDGIQSFFASRLNGSAFRSPRYAPEGGYTNMLVKRSFERERESHYDNREDQNYFIRVRTQLDEKGRVASAMYGKVYGDIECSYKGILRFDYYLNPTPNDRNMEFDPARNLFTGLPEEDEVRHP